MYYAERVNHQVFHKLTTGTLKWKMKINVNVLLIVFQDDGG